MDSSKNLFKIFVKFSSGNWASAVISFITVPITTRLIMPEAFGKAALFTLIVQLLTRFILLGADQSFVRHYYQKEKDELVSLLWNSMATPIVFIIVATMVIIGFKEEVSNYILGGYYTDAVVIFIGSVVLGVIGAFAINVVRMEQMALSYSMIITGKAITNVLTIILYAKFIEPSFYAILWGFFLGNVFQVFFSIAIRIKSWVGNTKISKKEIVESLKYGAPYVPAFIFMWVLEGIDKIAIREYSTYQELGLYSAAIKIIAVLSVLRTGFINFYAPVSIEKYESDETDTVFFGDMSLIVGFCTILLGALIIVCAPLIILLLGREYLSALTIMPFLVFIPIATILTDVTGRGIGFKKKTYWNIYITLFPGLINIGLNLLLVPKFGAKGAAISTAISFLIYFAFKTKVSTFLYQVNYHLSKVYAGLAVLFIMSFINTFIDVSQLEAVIINVLCIFLIIFVFYKSIRDKIKGMLFSNSV